MLRIYLLLLLLYFFTAPAQSQNIYAARQVKQLSDALKYYQKIPADDWMYFGCDSCVNPNEKSRLLLLLRKNLLLTGDLLKPEDTQSDILDENLESALKKFQRRHGLTDDGILGPQTIEAMNVPLSQRIGQISKHIEYWKTFSDTLAEPYLLVNIPDFTLALIDSGKVISSMKVIAGRPTNPTPVFLDSIYSVVLHPSWVVPYSIATKEIVPMLRTDPNYLNRNRMKMYTFQKRKKTEVSPDTVDWHRINVKSFNYFFEQTPGPWNALGQIKFILRNPFNIYLHDTPEKYLFQHPKRTYSHGCIRLEKPEALAAWLLKKDVSDIKKMIRSGSETKHITLPAPVPVAIDYITCWIDENGLLQFRQDIYQRLPAY